MKKKRQNIQKLVALSSRSNSQLQMPIWNFVTINAYNKEEKRSEINNLNIHFKILEKEEQPELKES